MYKHENIEICKPSETLTNNVVSVISEIVNIDPSCDIVLESCQNN